MNPLIKDLSRVFDEVQSNGFAGGSHSLLPAEDKSRDIYMSDGKLVNGSALNLLMHEFPYHSDRLINSERKTVPTVVAGSQMFMTPPKKENHSVRFQGSVNSQVKNCSAESNKRP